MTDLNSLENVINAAFDDRDNINSAGDVRDAVNAALDAMDAGTLRVAEKGADGWRDGGRKRQCYCHSLERHVTDDRRSDGSTWWDKVPSKFDGWTEERLRPLASALSQAVGCVAQPISHRAWSDAVVCEQVPLLIVAQ